MGTALGACSTLVGGPQVRPLLTLLLLPLVLRVCLLLLLPLALRVCLLLLLPLALCVCLLTLPIFASSRPSRLPPLQLCVHSPHCVLSSLVLSQNLVIARQVGPWLTAAIPMDIPTAAVS